MSSDGPVRGTGVPKNNPCPAAIFWLILFLNFVVGCEHSGTAIFYEIEQEQKIERANEGDNGYPTTMLSATVNNQARYYLSAHRLFWRPQSATGQDWNEIGSPNGYENIDYISAVTADTESIFVSATSNSSGNSALFQLNLSTHSWSGNLLSGFSERPQQIVRLLALSGNGHLRHFIVGRALSALGQYSLYYYNTHGTPQTTDDTLVTLWPHASISNDVYTEFIKDGGVVSGSPNHHLLLVSSSGVYCVADNGGVSDNALEPQDGGTIDSLYQDSSNPDGNNLFELRRIVVDSTTDNDRGAIRLGGIFVSTETDGIDIDKDGDNDRIIHISSGRGALYRYLLPDSGGGEVCTTNWKAECDTTTDIEGCWGKSDFGSTRYSYSDIEWFSDLGNPATGGLVVGIYDNGSIEGGYREILNGDISTIQDPRGSRYTSATISGTSVASFFVDDNTLFALTEGRGLWRAVYDAGVPIWSLDFSR